MTVASAPGPEAGASPGNLRPLPVREEPLPRDGPPIPQDRTVYEALGDQLFQDLVRAFYQRVETDPRLRPLFPADLSTAREKQYLFLTQYFGGPPRYSERYGPPRLRLRHLAFPIGPAEREAWLEAMAAAIAEVRAPAPYDRYLMAYFEQASAALVNR